MDEMKPKWNSRKVVFGLLMTAVGVGIELSSPRGLTETMAMFLGAIGAAYFAGNVAEHAVNGKAEAAKPSPSVDLAPLLEAVTQTNEGLAEMYQRLHESHEKTRVENAEIKAAVSTVMKGNSAIIQLAQGAQGA